MQFSENWLRTMVNPNMTSDQLAQLLTMSGLEVEDVEAVAPPFSNVVVAEVIEVHRHPNADRLNVCTVDVGTGTRLTIVCGAPNVRAILISEETVKAMKPGAVIVDLAVEQGGNCRLSELGKTVVKHGVHIVGEPNLATLVAADASALYARNVLDFMKLIVDKQHNLVIDREEEILKASLVCFGGELLRK